MDFSDVTARELHHGASAFFPCNRLPQDFCPAGRCFAEGFTQTGDAIAGTFLTEWIVQMPIGDKDAGFAEGRGQIHYANSVIFLTANHGSALLCIIDYFAV